MPRRGALSGMAATAAATDQLQSRHNPATGLLGAVGVSRPRGRAGRRGGHRPGAAVLGPARCRTGRGTPGAPPGADRRVRQVRSSWLRTGQAHQRGVRDGGAAHHRPCCTGSPGGAADPRRRVETPMPQLFLKTKRTAFTCRPLGSSGRSRPGTTRGASPSGRSRPALIAGNGVVLEGQASLTPLIGERIVRTHVFEQAQACRRADASSMAPAQVRGGRSDIVGVLHRLEWTPGRGVERGVRTGA